MGIYLKEEEEVVETSEEKVKAEVDNLTIKHKFSAIIARN